jgi:CRISPR-associated endonuclease/helicase Cas3
MSPERLWAKSRRDDAPEHPSLFLSGHLSDVFGAAMRVLDATGDNQLSALGLDPEQYRDRLRRCVLLAAAVHDIGKANNHFQDMIRGLRDVRQNPQGLRHEWVSILVLSSLEIWLAPALRDSEADFPIALWAIAGHHPSPQHQSPPTSPPRQGGSGPDILLLTKHVEFAAILEWLTQLFSLEKAPTELGSPMRQLNARDVFGSLRKWAKSSYRLWESFPRADRRLVAAVKSCLIGADVAGSALPRTEADEAPCWDWITRSLANLPEAGDLQKIADHRLSGNVPREFQQSVAASTSPVTYVKAGCGTGKTVGAYLWAATNHPTRRLYFCYPTTGTATEGFKDYLFEPDGELGYLGAKLFHSRRDVDFEIILGTGGDTENPEADMAARLESLEAWSTPIVACTVDMVLGLVQNNKRGLFAWPALAQGAFVFDEIHAYDDRLFGALLRFLRDLPGLPCLLMTASLPRAREEALFRSLRDAHGLDLEPIMGPKDLEELPRYHRLAVAGNDPLPLIQRELESGGKVLWVCNTVGRVMDAADRAGDLGPLIYHSRFRYEDRVERHKRVVEAFTPEHRGCALVICSQVAEMSLDLKGCTLLVTDLAPVPPLIQRLGRLNRQAKPGDPTRPFVVVEPQAGLPGWHLPYMPADLEAARAWLDRLPETDVSQKQLADLWEQSAENPPDPVPSAWLDGGPTTTVTELREASPGITVILNTPNYPDHDALLRYDSRVRAARRRARAENRKASHDELKRRPGEQNRRAAVTLPMPPPPKYIKWHDWKDWYKGIPVAPAGVIVYDPKRGARWAEQSRT